MYEIIMKIKITKNIVGASNEAGTQTKMYVEGSVFTPVQEWEKRLAQLFMESGHANEIKIVEPTETKKRARTKSGHYKPDDPSTPDVNEAWETKSS